MHKFNETNSVKRKNSENVEAGTSKKRLKLLDNDSNDRNTYEPEWSEHELLAEQCNFNLSTAKNIISLFEEGNTIPFIARYRRNMTNNMVAEELRAAKETYEDITALKKKIVIVIKNLEKSDVLTKELKSAIRLSRSAEELEHIYAPYKPGSKRTLAERAKELGLQEPAISILKNEKYVNLQKYVGTNEELSDVASVEKGVIHIIATFIATDTEILTSLRNLRSNTNCSIKTKKHTSKQMKENEDKFENYFNFEVSVKYVKPHQVLAINRGEKLKVLSVKIVIPDSFFHEFKNLFFKKWMSRRGCGESNREHILTQAVEDSYNRLIKPLITREIRSELKQKAERASCDVFSSNLKNLLLAPPIKGKPILAVDPGFSNGCKLALISSTGNLLANDVVYLHQLKNGNTEKEAMIIKNMLTKHNCELIALGNGTACRQTEEWLTTLIQKNYFLPLNVKYTIVREEGASIYSCSAEAKKEFPKLDPNIISAVSLARRIQDPLAELIKTEPKHLGIGMYQHDVKKKQLEEALNDVVSECVSFVGVDLNTASKCLLKHVAGLSDKRAQQIIDYRNKNGAFISRKQLLKVSGIGEKVFLQCAGFLRVRPLTDEENETFYKNTESTKLDCTNIHPESYNIAIQLIKKFNLKLFDIGEPAFTFAVKQKLLGLKLSELSNELKSDEETIQLILDALEKPLNHDFRTDNSKEPIFKQNLTSINDIGPGVVLTGVVNNVTHFGCFVDIGVGINGLIHVSKYCGLTPQIGNKIEVKVITVESSKKRIGLQALKLLT